MIEFLSWTLTLYWAHRLGHKSKWLMKFHSDHHGHVNKHRTSWRWNNILLFNDTWKSTIDFWFTEVIPTLIFCALFSCWWIFVFFWAWAALIQEAVEHNPRINIPLLSSGVWHLSHHKNPTINFGVYFTFWDKLFRTNQSN